MARTRTASVAADTTYGNGEFLQWLMERDITPYIRTRTVSHRNSPLYGPERFTFQPESNSYRCPAGEQLNYGGRSARNRTHVYIGTRKRCGACSQRPQCTSAPFRCLAIHMHQPARQRARDLVNTPAFAEAQRQRKKVKHCLPNSRIRSDSSPAPAEIKVCSGAFLPGSSRAKYQTAGPLPQPTNKATAASNA